MKLTLKLLAPYFAVGLFWCIFSNAWMAILAYHAQIILWTIYERPEINRIKNKRLVLISLPTVLTGGLLYFLFPFISHADLSTWYLDHHLSHLSLLIMVPYFGVIHPFLEQLHWVPLREQTIASHFFFAGYHMLVLYSLLSIPWLIICFLVLTGASFVWHYMYKQTRSIFVPYISHALADSSLIIATLFMV